MKFSPYGSLISLVFAG